MHCCSLDRRRLTVTLAPSSLGQRRSTTWMDPCRRTAMLITTTPGIEGRTVTEYLGVVTAQGVLGVNVFKDVGAGVRNIFGGRSKSYENELASGVSDALAELEQQAAHLGADAVVGVDIDYESVGDKMLMVSASGTAVRLG
jgi:uncharacterized protein YbjQ (UPF0145 family)